MPPRVRKKSARSPVDRRVAEGGCFFAGEAVRLAGISGLNYRQLRQLFGIVKGAEAAPGRWLRFSFKEVVALKVAYKLAAGKRTKHAGRRLHFAEVQRAIENVKSRYGVDDPLSQVQLDWDGDDIVVRLEGVHFEAASGQLLLVADSMKSNGKRLAWLRRADATELQQQLRGDLRNGASLARPTVCVTAPLKTKLGVG
jgi:hypothetical protein